MISKKNRFPLRENQDIFRHSVRKTGTYSDLYIHPVLEKNPQTSVIVGKNVSLLSVVRNRLKRQVAHIMTQDILPTVRKTIIVRVKSRALHSTYDQLKQELTFLSSSK